MQQTSTNEIRSVFTCRHEDYLRHLRESEQVPYDGPDAHCVGCGNAIEREEPVVIEGDEITCYDCHNDALAWASVMHCG